MSVNRIIRSSSYNYGEAYAPVMNDGLCDTDIDAMQTFSDGIFKFFGISPILLTKPEKEGLIQFEKNIALKADYELDTPVFLTAVYTDSIRIRLCFLELVCANRIKNNMQLPEQAENIAETQMRLNAIIVIRKGLIKYLSIKYGFCMPDEMTVCELTDDCVLQGIISSARNSLEPIELSLAS